MDPELAGVDHRSVWVEPSNCDGDEYWELLSAQNCCGVLVNVMVVVFPKFIDENVGVAGFPPPTSE